MFYKHLFTGKGKCIAMDMKITYFNNIFSCK